MKAAWNRTAVKGQPVNGGKPESTVRYHGIEVDDAL
jgi:hypothetical protein